MRMLLGIMFGVLLTVGVAYLADTTATAGDARMVNWEVVNRNLHSAGLQVRNGWDRLTGAVGHGIGNGEEKTAGTS
jgi:hypothetical protein